MTTDPIQQAVSDSYRVVLVDDDAQWAEMMCKLLGHEDYRLETEWITDPTDLFEVDGFDGVDCVVSDYDMEPLNGIELLQAVRERDPELPFILITGAGNEAIASEAISEGVTDYLMKQPGQNQTAILANRVSNAIQARRVDRELEKTREQFTSLFRNVPDPMAITDDGEIDSFNPAFESTFGRDERLPEPTAQRELGPSMEITCETLDGPRAFLYRTIELTATDRVCHIYTDITERTEHERMLRLERDTKEAVTDLLLATSTRREAEQTFCDQLIGQLGYSYVWVGELDHGDLEIRASAGTDYEYGDHLRENQPNDPGLTALRTQTRCSLADFDRNALSAPDATSVEEEFHRAVAVPLVHDGIPYGVVSAYATDRNGGGRETLLLDDLADVLAYAIHAATRRQALFDENVVEVALQFPPDAYPPMRLFEPGEEAPEIEGTVPHSEDTVQHFLKVPATDPSTGRLDDHEEVREVRVVETTEECTYLDVVLSTPTVESLLVDGGGRVESIDIEGDRVNVTVTFSTRHDVRSVIERVKSVFADVSVSAYRTSTREGKAQTAHSWESLTERQLEVLKAAYHGGFFEYPKRQNAEEVADSLDISRPTFLEHLRTAERKVFEELFESGQE